MTASAGLRRDGSATPPLDPGLHQQAHDFEILLVVTCTFHGSPATVPIFPPRLSMRTRSSGSRRVRRKPHGSPRHEMLPDFV